MRQSRSPKIVTFSHCMVALAMLLKGIAKADDLSHNWPLVALCFSSCLLIVSFVLFHHQIERRWLRVSPLVSLLESIVTAALGAYSLQHGQRLLPYAWFLAAAMAGGATVIQLVALRREKA